MRSAHLRRKTKETQILLHLLLDGSGEAKVATTIPFLDHMLTSFSKHALFDIEIKAKGDTHIDDHHLTEDIGIVLGQGVLKALGTKRGIYRFGSAYAPLDEALVRCVIDFCQRPFMRFQLTLRRRRVGQFDTELVEEFFKGFMMGAQCNLHLHQIEGRNTHHIIEAAFKAFALATSQAVSKRQGAKGIPSTKGML